MVATVKTKERRKRGRPCGYNDEIVDKILGRIGDGESLRAVCADKGMPNRATVFRWIARYPEFRDLYGFAREWQAHCLAGDVIEIANDSRTDIAGGRLRINALKCRIARLAPKKYGKQKR